MRPSQFTLLFSALAASAFACSPPDPALDREGADIVIQSPSLPTNLCDLLNSLPGGSIGAVSINKPTCTPTPPYHDLYYFGDLGHPEFSYMPVTPNPRAQNIANALFCTLGDSNGADANAAPNSPLGRFGMETSLNITRKDPTARVVTGERVGTLYLFGIPIPLDNQDFTASFPTESYFANGSLDPWVSTGYYMDLQTTTTTWQLGGSGYIAPFSLSLDFGQTGNFQALQNDAIAWSPQTTANGPNPQFAWSNVFESAAACATCAAEDLFCTCPSATQIAEHNQTLNETDAQFRNLSDDLLPYTGVLGGVVANSVYNETSNNWFQFGMADGNTQPGDPSHTGASFTPSTYFDFKFDVDFDIIQLILDLNVRFRSGMELIQDTYYYNEYRNRFAGTDLMVDAESAVALTADLQIDNPFPFGPSILANETFNIYTNNTPAEAEGAHAQMNYADGSAVAFSGPAGETSVAQCMQDAPVIRNEVAPGNPENFLGQVATAAGQQLHPCNIQLCAPTSSGISTLSTCTWNAATSKVSCTATSTPCIPCDTQQIDLCDNSGNVYTPTSTTINAACPPVR